MQPPVAPSTFPLALHPCACSEELSSAILQTQQMPASSRNHRSRRRRIFESGASARRYRLATHRAHHLRSPAGRRFLPRHRWPVHALLGIRGRICKPPGTAGAAAGILWRGTVTIGSHRGTSSPWTAQRSRWLWWHRSSTSGFQHFRLSLG